jgi:hypothetical protein
MIRIKFLLVIILFLSPMSLLAESDNSSSEAGLFYSTSWGSGVMGGYNYSNEIDFGASLSSGDTSTESEGPGTSIKSQSTFMTVNGFGRYYLRDLGITDGLFGQAGLAFRNWTGKGSIIDDRTQAKIASIKIDWSPVVIVTGVGWQKVWDFGLIFSVAMNASIGGSRTIEYTENMHRFSDSMKKDLEKKTDYPTNLVIYIGYSF